MLRIMPLNSIDSLVKEIIAAKIKNPLTNKINLDSSTHDKKSLFLSSLKFFSLNIRGPTDTKTIRPQTFKR